MQGLDGIAAGPYGALWFTTATNSIGRITTAGVVTTYTDSAIVESGAITAGPDGAMWFVYADSVASGNAAAMAL